MAIHKSFPTSPYEQLNPEYRWFPADETLRDISYAGAVSTSMFYEEWLRLVVKMAKGRGGIILCFMK